MRWKQRITRCEDGLTRSLILAQLISSWSARRWFRREPINDRRALAELNIPGQCTSSDFSVQFIYFFSTSIFSLVSIFDYTYDKYQLPKYTVQNQARKSVSFLFVILRFLSVSFFIFFLFFVKGRKGKKHTRKALISDKSWSMAKRFA